MSAPRYSELLAAIEKNKTATEELRALLDRLSFEEPVHGTDDRAALRIWWSVRLQSGEPDVFVGVGPPSGYYSVVSVVGEGSLGSAPIAAVQRYVDIRRAIEAWKTYGAPFPEPDPALDRATPRQRPADVDEQDLEVV